jgi:hypothetical protein
MLVKCSGIDTTLYMIQSLVTGTSYLITLPVSLYWCLDVETSSGMDSDTL